MQTADGSAIRLIEDEAQLDALRAELQACPHLAIDTEFMRTNTFYPILGLIQLADLRGCYLVDPVLIKTHQGIAELVSGASQTFVMHSCSEDLNLLHTSLNRLPVRLFDTQLAAAFLGLGFSLSYQALVRNLLNIEIPKDETRSDWIKRPLSDTQKIYAATDVCYLLTLREILEAQLRERGMYEWFVQECDDQLSIAREIEVESNWNLAYTGISNAWRLNDAALVCLHRLALWREITARRRNKPRSWIAKDNDLTLIASRLAESPTMTMDELKTLQHLDPQVVTRYGQDLLQYMRATAAVAVTVDRALLNIPLPIDSRKHMKMCQEVVQRRANDLNMAPELLGRKKLLVELVRNFEHTGELVWPDNVSQWRRDLLESDLLKALRR